VVSCNPNCPTNTVSTPLDQTTVSVAGTSGTTNPSASMSLVVNTDTVSCGPGYNYATAVSTLSTTDFAASQSLTVTSTIGGAPSTRGVKVCFLGAGSNATLLKPCASPPVAPCLVSLQEQSGSVVATFLSPANDPRFWTGDATVILKKFSPSKGKAGSTVTIKGKNLSQVNSVVIGGASATINTAKSTASKLVVTVPPSSLLESAPITVVADSGTEVSTKSFTVT
jgi:hypothetical protein